MRKMRTTRASRLNRKPSKAPQSATAPRSLNPDDYEIAAVIDWGTSQCSSAAQILLKGSEPNPNATRILPLQPNVLQVSQIIGFAKIDNEFQFLWGDEFEETMEANDFHRDELFIFKHPKMFFFPSAVKDRERSKAERELERYATACGIDEELTLEWLMTLHFTLILHAATSAIHRLWGLTWSPAQLEAMHKRFIITAPEISTRATDRALSDVIKTAGFPPGIMPVKETEAAAACQMRKYLLSKQGLPHGLQEGDQVIVADGGGLTVNAVSYALGKICDAAAATDLHLIDKKGEACGSETITESCQEYLRDYCHSNPSQNPNGFEGCLEDLGMSPTQFAHRISVNFESYKARFTREDCRIITLYGRNFVTGQRSEKQFTVTKDLVRSWFLPVFNKIVRMLELLITPQTKLLLLTGGLFQSEWLVNRLKSHLSARNIEIPKFGRSSDGTHDPSVIEGALARFVARPPDLPTDLGYGVLQDEEYSPDLHPDIKSSKSGLGIFHTCTPKACWAKDRWKNLIPYGSLANFTTLTPVYLEFYVHRSEASIQEQVYSTDHAIENHSAVLSNHQLPAGVEKYLLVEKHIDVEVLKRYPRRLMSRADEKRMYGHRVFARLVARVVNANVKLEWELAAPEYEAEKEDFDENHPPSTSNELGLAPDLLNDEAYPTQCYRNRYKADDPKATERQSTSDLRGAAAVALSSDVGKGSMEKEGAGPSGRENHGMLSPETETGEEDEDDGDGNEDGDGEYMPPGLAGGKRKRGKVTS